MAFKSFSNIKNVPLIVDLTIENRANLRVLYATETGFYAIDLDGPSSHLEDVICDTRSTNLNSSPSSSSNNCGQRSINILIMPKNSKIIPHCIAILPNTNGTQLLLCYNNEGVYYDTSGNKFKSTRLQWGELPESVVCIAQNTQVMGWGTRAIEIRNSSTSQLEGVFTHKKIHRLKYMCEKNDIVYFSSIKSGSVSQIYYITLNQPKKL
ncbi:hypothetical protein ACOME3_008837 [Neoechinorhynchus agilis]